MSAEIIKALTEEVANLTAELNATNETVDMLYQRTSRFSAQADRLEKELNAAQSLLLRAHNSLCEGYTGGEWSAHVPDEISYAAAKEHAEAMEVVTEIRKLLRLDK